MSSKRKRTPVKEPRTTLEGSDSNVVNTVFREISKAISHSSDTSRCMHKNDLCGAIVSEVHEWVGTAAIPKAEVSDVFRVKLEEVFIKCRQGTCDKDNKEALESRISFIKGDEYYISILRILSQTKQV